MAAYDEAIREGAFAEKLDGQVPGNKLQELIGSEPHLRVRDIAEWSARYVHMKRVRDEAVLARAMEERKRSVKSACRRSGIEAMMGGWQRQQTECPLTA